MYHEEGESCPPTFTKHNGIENAWEIVKLNQLTITISPVCLFSLVHNANGAECLH